MQHEIASCTEPFGLRMMLISVNLSSDEPHIACCRPFLERILQSRWVSVVQRAVPPLLNEMHLFAPYAHAHTYFSSWSRVPPARNKR